MIKKLFAWWDGATFGTLFDIAKGGSLVGTDEQGNKYYEERVAKSGSADGVKRRWVVYHGVAEASRVPSDWHGWLHHTFDEPPTTAPLKRQAFEQDHLPNMTGTPLAYHPKGSLARGGETPKKVYDAWSPDA